jgi:hypothetical protein
MSSPEDSEDVIKNISSFVHTYEHFCNQTKFPYPLYNKFERMTPAEILDVLNYLSNENNTNAVEVVNYFIEKCTDISNTDGYVLNNDTTVRKPGYQYMFPIGPTSTDNMYILLTSSYTDPLPALGPAQDDTIMQLYMSKMLTMFTMVFFMVYNVLAVKISNIGGSQFSSKFGYLASFASFYGEVQALCNVLFQYEAFNTSMTLDTYIKNITTNVYDKTVNKIFTEPIKRQLFIACFYPYFVYKYMCNFILPSPKLSATSKGSRNAYVRRAAIMGVYMYHAYFFFSVYVLSARISPSSDFTYKLRMIMDSNAIHPFNQESINDSGQVTALEDKAKQAFQMSTRIDNTNREIEMSRSNINKVLGAEPALKKRLKKATVIKWLWFGMIMVYIVLISVIYILAKLPIGKTRVPLLISIGQITSIVTIIGLCLSGTIYVSKKF